MRKRKPKIPVSMPGGRIAPHMSARARTQMVDDVFMSIGGPEKLASWANANDDNYREFLKIWARGQLRQAETEQRSDKTTMEDVIARLDAGEHAKVIIATAEHDE